MTISVDLLNQLNSRLGVDLTDLEKLLRQLKAVEAEIDRIREEDELSEPLQIRLAAVSCDVFDVGVSLHQIVHQLKLTAYYL